MIPILIFYLATSSCPQKGSSAFPLDRLEYGAILLNIRQFIRKVLPSLLSLQTCFDNSVLFSYLSCLKLVKWFASRCLKGVLVKPMYIFGAGVLGISIEHH